MAQIASRSLTGELMTLNETLQPEAAVEDCRYAFYRLGHIQEVRLQELWNFVPKEYYGGPKLGQCDLVLGISGA
jgi:hypothetical protein